MCRIAYNLAVLENHGARREGESDGQRKKEREGGGDRKRGREDGEGAMDIGNREVKEMRKRE